MRGVQLHQQQEHPDTPLLQHAQELIAKLDELGIKPSPLEDEEEGDGWESVDESVDGDGDVDME